MKKSTAKKENTVSIPSVQKLSKTVDFPIVGIGASAGGLEALEQFFQNVADIPRPARRKPKTGNQNSTARELGLEIELQRAHEELQSTREEMQTMQEELKSTNEEMQSTKKELQSTNNQRWFTNRIMPYRTYDDRIDGLVITFIEITKAKTLETELNKTIAVLREHKLYKS